MSIGLEKSSYNTLTDGMAVSGVVAELQIKRGFLFFDLLMRGVRCVDGSQIILGHQP